MDTSNFHIDFFGSNPIARKFKQITPICNSPKIVYSAQVNSDSDSSDGPCHCLKKCISCADEKCISCADKKCISCADEKSISRADKKCISCADEKYISCKDSNKETCKKETPIKEKPINNCLPKHIKRSIEALQSIKDRVLNSDTLDDEFSHLGKNIACQLRQLPLSEALNLQLEILTMLKERREAAQSARLDRSSSSSYTTEYTFEIQNTIAKVDSLKEIDNTENNNDD